jgi:hypothetical protein
VTKKEADDIKRLFGVLAEDLRSDIRQVAEGVGLLNERFDGLDAKVDRIGRELTAEIRQVAGAQADLRERVTRLESSRA